jgi:RNA polymerase sigma-70 factor (ECF subfamily)
LVRHAQWQPGTRLDSWVFRITHTIWLDELRSRKVRAAEPEEVLERVAGDDGDRRVEARLTLDAVRRAIARLPEEQRAVLMLVCVEGMSYKEAAESLAIPVGTVMSRLSRGRQSLHAMLGEGAWS